jgi:hypothetical protein
MFEDSMVKTAASGRKRHESQIEKSFEKEKRNDLNSSLGGLILT